MAAVAALPVHFESKCRLIFVHSVVLMMFRGACLVGAGWTLFHFPSRSSAPDVTFREADTGCQRWLVLPLEV